MSCEAGFRQFSSIDRGLLRFDPVSGHHVESITYRYSADEPPSRRLFSFHLKSFILNDIRSAALKGLAPKIQSGYVVYFQCLIEGRNKQDTKDTYRTHCRKVIHRLVPVFTVFLGV